MQNDLGQLVSQTEESISGLKAIKAYNAQDFLIRKFEKRNQSLFENTKSTYYKVDFASPFSSSTFILYKERTALYSPML